MRAVLEESLSGTGGIATLLFHPSTESAETLAAIRDFVLRDIDPDIAMSDPALYRKLSRLRTEMILRGWYRYFEG